MFSKPTTTNHLITQNKNSITNKLYIRINSKYDNASYPPAAKTFTICWVNLIAHLVYSNLEGCNASTAK